MSILGTEMSCLYLITSGISFAFCINKWQCGGLYTGCVGELGDFATLFFSGSATLGWMPLSPFCCQL